MTYEIHIKVYNGDGGEERAESFAVEATDVADLETKLGAVSILTEASIEGDADMNVLTWRQP